MISKSSVIVLCCAVFFATLGATEKLYQEEIQRHDTTDWQVEPSFKFDVLCLLNSLTSDPFYLKYYKSEYKKFESALTSSVKSALANLKRKIKDENQGIISAFLCLYFSATEDKTLDDILNTLKNNNLMRTNLKQTPYFNESGWQLYESVQEDLKTIFLFLKDIQFESYWKINILPKIKEKISHIEKDLPNYNVISRVEEHLGSGLPSNKITVFMLYYSQTHGIKITGT